MTKQIKTRKIKIALYKNSKTLFGRVIRVQQYIQEFFSCIKFFGFFKTVQVFWIGDFSKDYLYSHAEIIFCDLKRSEKLEIIKSGALKSELIRWKKKNRKIVDEEDIFSDIFFSSSECDGGCRFKRILPKTNHWDLTTIAVTEKQYAKVFHKAILLNGKKYSKWGILFAQAFNLNYSDSDRYFCSQIVSILLHEAFGSKFSKSFFWKYTHFINPRKLSKRLSFFIE
jgi:hypothetical protein